MVKKLDTTNFEETISSGVSLVDFWATWCGPCKMLSPIIDSLATKIEDAIIAKVNIDEARAIAEKFNVSSIPTIIIFKDGEEKERITGVKPEGEILKILNKYL